MHNRRMSWRHCCRPRYSSVLLHEKRQKHSARTMDIEHIRSRFIKHFDGKTGNIYFAPGRINLIGEHTDYNGGYTLSGAIDKGIMAELRPNGSNTVMCYSIDHKDRIEFKIDDSACPRTSWARYIYGIVQEMRKLGVEVKGFNTAFSGNIPQGAGIGSSAALECCYAFALNDLFGNNKVSAWDMVLAGQAAEQQYCGVNCGVVDQFASIFGKKDRLICLDCRSHINDYITFKPNGHKLILIDTKLHHTLADSAYNARRKSCENVVKSLQAQFPDHVFETLRDAEHNMLESIKDKVSEEDLKRAHHVFEENRRVQKVCQAMRNNDYETIGKKMYESHESLNTVYEVSCEELNYLNQIALDNKVTGSRMMGGGFGGCTINLVKESECEAFVNQARQRYVSKFNHVPDFHEVKIGDGAQKIC